MPESVIRVAFEPSSERARYAAETLLRLLGLRWCEVEAGAEAELVYGNPRDGARCTIPAGPQDGWDEPRPLVARDQDIAILHRPNGGARVAGSRPTDLGFDALYATYACLTAPWEADDPGDEVDCPIAGEGWLSANGLLEDLPVHRFAAALGRALAAADIQARTPEPSIVLTHDVDSNFGHLFARRESWALLLREIREGRPSAVRRALGLGRRLLNRQQSDPNDRFEEWGRLASASGGRPAYFVASYGLFDQGSRRYDVPYAVTHPEVGATLRRLVGEGAELGIHFSLQAGTSEEQLRHECERLEEAIGVPIRSARHHWWAVGRPPERVLDWHARAGIRVDSSFGFNDRPGFRRGIAAPFRPFDRRNNRPLPLWELPTCAMDLAVFDGTRTREDGVKDLLRLLDLVRQVGGALVLDWHAHALNPQVLNGAGDGLRRFLSSEATAGLRLRTPLELVDELERGT